MTAIRVTPETLVAARMNLAKAIKRNVRSVALSDIPEPPHVLVEPRREGAPALVLLGGWTPPMPATAAGCLRVDDSTCSWLFLAANGMPHRQE
jgi:hypothetical protein